MDLVIEEDKPFPAHRGPGYVPTREAIEATED